MLVGFFLFFSFCLLDSKIKRVFIRQQNEIWTFSVVEVYLYKYFSIYAYTIQYKIIIDFDKLLGIHSMFSDRFLTSFKRQTISSWNNVLIVTVLDAWWGDREFELVLIFKLYIFSKLKQSCWFGEIFCSYQTWTIVNGTLFSLFHWNFLSTSHWLIELIKLLQLFFFYFIFLFVFCCSVISTVSVIYVSSFIFFISNQNDFLFSFNTVAKQKKSIVELDVPMFWNFLDSLRCILLLLSSNNVICEYEYVYSYHAYN